jgi:hypothetical protein
MPNENIGQLLRRYLLSHGVACEAGVSEERLMEFEQLHNIRMPVDFRDYFLTMNGCSAGGYGYGIVRFWNLEEVKTVAEEIPGNRPPTATVIQSTYNESIEGGEEYFVFADVMHDMQLYAIHLSTAQSGLNDIVVIDGSAPWKVANNFSEFIHLYLSSPALLRLVVE